MLRIKTVLGGETRLLLGSASGNPRSTNITNAWGIFR
jgi:hypothetical protein